MLENTLTIGPVTRAIAAMQDSVDRTTPLSNLFRCPVLRDVFRRAERDNDGAFAAPAPKAPVLDGGATFRSARDLVLA